MPKGSSKRREWEKIRRDRLNECFTELNKQFPCYDPSIVLSKIEILEKAVKYIIELQNKTKELLNPDGVNKAERNEIKELNENIKKLIARNELLNKLLKDAGITVPKELAVIKKFKFPRPWTNRITPEQANILAKKEAQKENNVAKTKVQLKKSTKSKNKLKSGMTVKHKKNVFKKGENRKLIKKIKVLQQNVVSSKCLIVITQPSLANTQPYYIITNAPSNSVPKTTGSTTVVTNSNLLSTPLVTASIKPPTTAIIPKKNTPLSALGPGTLILPNGNIIPVLPPIPTILPTTPSPLFVNQTPNNTTLIVVPSSVKDSTTVSSSIKTSEVLVNSSNKEITTKTFTAIKPKIGGTRTVHVNKVPIPSCSSYCANNTVINSQNLITKVKTSSKKTNEATKTTAIETKTTDSSKRKLTNEESETNEEAKRIKTAVNDKDDQAKKTVTSTYSIDSLCNENLDILPQHEKEVEIDCNKSKSNTKEDNVQENCKSPEKTSTKDSVVEKTEKTDKENEENKKTDEAAKAACVVIEKNNDKNEKTVENDQQQSKTLELNLPHSDLSNDIFATLQVPTGGQNPESTSPTAAFLLAFPLVSTLTGVKVTEVIEEENSDSQRGTPTLLQIGTMDTTKPTQSESLTPSLLNLDNFSFFSSKDICNSFYPPFDNFINTTTTCPVSVTSSVTTTSVVTTNANNPDNTSKSNVSLEASLKETKMLFERSTKMDVITTKEKCVQEPSANVKYSNTQTYTQPVYGSVQAIHSYQKTKQPDGVQKTNEKSCARYTVPVVNKSTYTQSQCNTFNPFTDISKSNSVCSYNSKSCTEPLYTNSTYTYNYHPETNFNQVAYNSAKNVASKTETRSCYSLNYENSYSDYKSDNRKYGTSAAPTQFLGHYYNTNQQKDKFSSLPKGKNNSNQPRPPVNWMTTPDLRQQAPTTDYLLPPVDFTQNSIYSSNSFVTNPQTTYFNTNSSMYPSADIVNSFAETRKTLDGFTVMPTNTFQRNDVDENQFSWSPTKLPILETQHSFVSSTLPTLVGDLALGNTSASFMEQKGDSPKNSKDNFRNKDRRNKTQTGYDNQTNFLSVSQLVDHNKSEVLPARTTSRRNSGNRSNKTNLQQKNQKRVHKTAENKEPQQSMQNFNQNNSNKPVENASVKNQLKQHHNINYNVQNQSSNNNTNTNWVADANKTNRHVVPTKNPSSSYSAEALIGHQAADNNLIPKQRHNANYNSTSKTLPVSSFLSDNTIIPYFPPVDLAQDTTFIPQNQNYQNTSFGHNFVSTVQNNTYVANNFVSGSAITTNYLPTTNFMPEIGTTHDYNTMVSDNLNLFPHASGKITEKQCNKNLPPPKVNFGSKRTEERKNVVASSASCSVASSNNNFSKKTKRKHLNDTNLPGFNVDFNFLSVPGTINSPILPDDFHSHANFLPPPPPAPSQLYPCKNPLYPPKQNTDLAASSLLQLPPVTRTNNIQHPEISPSINNVGTSLANFNLSTIFPEINKGSTLPDLYAEPTRNKDYTSHRNYLPPAPQVPFSTKPSFTSTYITTVANSFSNS